MQAPTGYIGLYKSWYIDNADGDDDLHTGADDVWDFGTSSQYPALKADMNGDAEASWEEFGSLGRPMVTPTPPPLPAATHTPSANSDTAADRYGCTDAITHTYTDSDMYLDCYTHAYSVGLRAR